MKQNRLTLFALLGIFLLLIGLLFMQSAQRETLEPTPTNAILRENEIQLDSGLIFPDLQAEDVAVVNILDPVLNSQVTVGRSSEGIWQVVSEDNRPTNQAYANSLAVTLENIPYITRIGVSEDTPYGTFGLNEHDALVVVSAVMKDESLHTFMVGNPVSTDSTTRGFYTVVDDNEEIYIVPPEPILYLVQYLEAFENTQKLDN